MGSLKFFALYSTACKPEELVVLGEDCKTFPEARGPQSCEGVLPLPLPKIVLVFAVGDWPENAACQQMAARIKLGKGLAPFSLGTLSKTNRAICWQGTWREDLETQAALLSEQGQLGYLTLSPADPKAELEATIKDECTVKAEDDNPDPMETSQTESQLADLEERLEKTEEMTLSQPACSTKTGSKQTPPSAARRPKAEVTPEVTGQLSTPPAMSSEGRKKRKPAAEQSTPRGQSRVKRLQMQKTQQTSPSVKTETQLAKTPQSKASGSGTVPSARWGHSMCAISSTQALVIGGQGENQVLSKDSVWLLDTDDVKWWVPAIPLVDATKPQYRMGHTAVYDSKVKCVYVYGGSKNLRWYNDVHVLDVESWRWSLVKTTGRAPTRAYHTSTLYKNEMYVFGGVYPNPDPEPDGCSNQLHVFNPASESWYEPLLMGKKPKARSGHSATLLGDRLIIFGGWDAPECFNDIHCLDLSLMDFTSIEATGTPPSPRSWHASSSLPGNRIVIQGGFDGENAMTDAFVLSLDMKCWTRLVWPFHTSPTAGHTILTIDQLDDDKENESQTDASQSQRLFIFGGGNNEGTFSNKLVAFKLQLPAI